MAELSIIVPIYNVEAYLPRCIESILAQTFTDFELILINDGSADHCAQIMEAYAQKDKRIITIHQENQGVSAARNAGLKIATGKYVGFVDPDDWIDEYMYEIMIRDLKKAGSQLVCCNWDCYTERMERTEHVVKDVPLIMNREEFFVHFVDIPRTISGAIWNKIFVREYIKHLFDIHTCIGEDWLFTAKYSLDVTKVSYVNKTMYHWFERESSATRKNADKVALGLQVNYQVLEISKNVSEKARKYAERDYLDACLIYYNKYVQNPASEYLQLGRRHFCQYMGKNWAGVLKNRYIFWKTRLLYLWKFIQAQKYFCCLGSELEV